MRTTLALLRRVLWTSMMAMASLGAMQQAAASGPSDLVLPFAGPGQLIMIVASRSNRPEDRRLVLVARDGLRVLPIESVSSARWRSPDELIVDQGQAGYAGDKIIRSDLTGKIVETLASQGFVQPAPAPDGRRIAVVRLLFDDVHKGSKGLEIRDLEANFKLLLSVPPNDLSIFGIAELWSPDGNEIALASHSDVKDYAGNPSIAVVSMENGAVRYLYDDPAKLGQDESGVAPIFWDRSGIYARGGRGLLRCDPQGTGCALVYEPGHGRHIARGTLFGVDSALILVQDVETDPIEARAKEIHLVDLKAGKGRLWVRLPDDLFVWDIDWVRDPDVPSRPPPRLP